MAAAGPGDVDAAAEIETPALRRLREEQARWETDEFIMQASGCTIEWDETNAAAPITIHLALPDKIKILDGPEEESPYGGRTLEVAVSISAHYPKERPFVRFKTIPYHPQVLASGFICPDHANGGLRWSEEMTMLGLIHYLRGLFGRIEPCTCISRQEILDEILSNKGEFLKKARKDVEPAA